MKHFLAILLTLMFCARGVSQPLTLPLYPDGSVTEIADGGEWEPEIMVWLPGKPNGQAVVICPGGGYKGLATSHEGSLVAKWLNERGIAGVVLRYRMPRGRYEVPETDARKAMATVRIKAAEWGIDPAKVGIMGFSAGGHLASTIITRFTDADRPNFGILFYPVITMSPPFVHGGSKSNLMGTAPDKAVVEKYSSERNVTAATPPVFLALSSDDRGVKPRNATMFYDSLNVHKIPSEIHIYPTGNHGWGFGNTTFKYYDEMKAVLSRWLSEQNAK